MGTEARSITHTQNLNMVSDSCANDLRPWRLKYGHWQIRDFTVTMQLMVTIANCPPLIGVKRKGDKIGMDYAHGAVG